MPRRLGRSGVEVTALGLGTAALGNLYSAVDESEAQATVAHAVACGLGYVDTAPQYGHGLAEQRLGAALRTLPRESPVLSTKVGRLLVPDVAADSGHFSQALPNRVEFDFSAAGVERSLRESLERLGVERVDVVYIHDPDDHAGAALRDAYPALARMRAAGVVGAVGIGMNQWQVPLRFVRETDVDVVLLAGRYTLLDQSGLDELLPACVERGVSVVVGGVYNSGILADPSPGAAFDYAPAPPEWLRRARRLGDACEAHGVPLKAAAMQFPLAHPAVSCVLVGPRSRAELDENLAMLEHPVPAALWEALRADGLLPPHAPVPGES